MRLWVLTCIDPAVTLYTVTDLDWKLGEMLPDGHRRDPDNAFESVTCKVAANMFRSQYVNQTSHTIPIDDK